MMMKGNTVTNKQTEEITISVKYIIRARFGICIMAIKIFGLTIHIDLKLMHEYFCVYLYPRLEEDGVILV